MNTCTNTVTECGEYYIQSLHKATFSPGQCKQWSTFSVHRIVCLSLGYMLGPLCSVQTVGLYKGRACISDVMTTAAFYPPLFMSVGRF